MGKDNSCARGRNRFAGHKRRRVRKDGAWAYGGRVLDGKLRRQTGFMASTQESSVNERANPPTTVQNFSYHGHQRACPSFVCDDAILILAS